MSEIYKQKEYEIKSAIDNINSIPYIFENYVKETNSYIDILLEETKEINALRNIIKEVREEIRMLETNCDIADYQAQKLFNILDKVEDNK